MLAAAAGARRPLAATLTAAAAITITAAAAAANATAVDHRTGDHEECPGHFLEGDRVLRRFQQSKMADDDGHEDLAGHEQDEERSRADFRNEKRCPHYEERADDTGNVQIRRYGLEFG